MGFEFEYVVIENRFERKICWRISIIKSNDIEYDVVFYGLEVTNGINSRQ